MKNAIWHPMWLNQSIMTSPGEFAPYFEALPTDLGTLRLLVQDLVAPENLVRKQNPSLWHSLYPDMQTRKVSTLLKILIQRDKQSLVAIRRQQNRFLGAAYHAALLLCSMLRYQQVPARTRVAFLSYDNAHLKQATMVVEYWSAAKRKWCLLDPFMKAASLSHENQLMGFSAVDVPRQQLQTAPYAWQLCQEGVVKATSYGTSQKRGGLWLLRDRLIQDMAGLMQHEMQPWDVWGGMLQGNLLKDYELDFYNRLARYLIQPEQHLTLLKALFKEHPYLKIPALITTTPPSPDLQKRVLHKSRLLDAEVIG